MSLTKVSYSMINGAPANALDFGADPTGVADSSAAFAAAFAVSDQVYAPKGVYKATIDLGSNQQLLGAGNGSPSSTVYETCFIPVAGASYVIRIDAITSGKRNCLIQNIGIANPNSVANCTGIAIKGTDVNSINDDHVFTQIQIYGFQYGVRVTGRLIGSLWSKVIILGCTDGFKATTDTSTPAFIFNDFNSCYFNDNTNSAFRVESVSNTTRMTTCNFQGNALGAGVAATYFYNPQILLFENCYWEQNGNDVAVNAVDAAANAISLHIAGDTITALPSIKNCFFEGSGCGIFINSLVLNGGKIEVTSIAPKATGFGIAVHSTPNQAEAQMQFCISANNNISGTIEVKAPAEAESCVYIEQTEGNMFVTSNPAIDLMRVSNFTAYNASAWTLSAPAHRFPGCKLFIYAGSTGGVTMPAAVMKSGVDEVVASGTGKTFMVAGYPWFGKFIVV